MDPSAAKLIGAGLASIALVGAGVGIGTIFGNYLQGALRNPSAAPGQFANLLLGFALAEATGLFGLVVALIILFVFYPYLEVRRRSLQCRSLTPSIGARSSSGSRSPSAFSTC